MESNMQHIVITLVFSIVMLFFMLYPSILIVEFLKKYFNISEKKERILLILFTVILSIGIGVFLRV